MTDERGSEDEDDDEEGADDFAFVLPSPAVAPRSVISASAAPLM